MPMRLVSSLQVSDEERLKILRRLDQFRNWRSLNDKRYCLVCEKIITGHQIQLTDGTRGNGALRLSCPTERCHSIPMDWVLPTAEVMANAAAQEAAHMDAHAQRGNRDARQNTTAALAPVKAAIPSRLRTLAALFGWPG